jgi:hypothetical protein
MCFFSESGFLGLSGWRGHSCDQQCGLCRHGSGPSSENKPSKTPNTAVDTDQLPAGFNAPAEDFLSNFS